MTSLFYILRHASIIYSLSLMVNLAIAMPTEAKNEVFQGSISYPAETSAIDKSALINAFNITPPKAYLEKLKATSGESLIIQYQNLARLMDAYEEQLNFDNYKRLKTINKILILDIAWRITNKKDDIDLLIKKNVIPVRNIYTTNQLVKVYEASLPKNITEDQSLGNLSNDEKLKHYRTSLTNLIREHSQRSNDPEYSDTLFDNSNIPQLSGLWISNSFDSMMYTASTILLGYVQQGGDVSDGDAPINIERAIRADPSLSKESAMIYMEAVKRLLDSNNIEQFWMDM